MCKLLQPKNFELFKVQDGQNIVKTKNKIKQVVWDIILYIYNTIEIVCSNKLWLNKSEFQFFHTLLTPVVATHSSFSNHHRFPVLIF